MKYIRTIIMLSSNLHKRWSKTNINLSALVRVALSAVLDSPDKTENELDRLKTENLLLKIKLTQIGEILQ